MTDTGIEERVRTKADRGAFLSQLLTVSRESSADVHEDFVKQLTENIYKRWRYESTKGISDKYSNEDGETLERFYNRINLDEKRHKILDDSRLK